MKRVKHIVPLWSLPFYVVPMTRSNHLGFISQRVYELIIHAWKNKCLNVNTNYLIISQFCTCHDSLAVMTCAKLWHDWMIQIKIITNIIIFERFNHKLINPLWNGAMTQWGLLHCVMGINIVKNLLASHKIYKAVIFCLKNTLQARRPIGT